MENIVYAALGKLFTVFFLLIDTVSTDIDVCYETSSYRYYCDDGKECCENDTACCDSGLSTGAIVGICFGCGFGLAALAACISCLEKGTPVGIDGVEAGTTRVQVIGVQRDPPTYTASSMWYGQSGSGYPAAQSDSANQAAINEPQLK